jgi:hypothetical protein
VQRGRLESDRRAHADATRQHASAGDVLDPLLRRAGHGADDGAILTTAEEPALRARRPAVASMSNPANR